MRLVVARCSVSYEGRLNAALPEATRLIMVKQDGCVAIHADGGVITNPKGETLTIFLHEVLSDSSHDLGTDPGLMKDGVEAHLQELLAGAPNMIEDGLTLIRREFPTAVGPVDLLCRAADGRTVAVEIKRRGEIDGVEQLTRYIDCLRADSSLGDIRGIFVAQSIKPQARVLAESRGMSWREVDYDELKGTKPDDLTLF
jgi:RecB family endonuclease NucS